MVVLCLILVSGFSGLLIILLSAMKATNKKYDALDKEQKERHARFDAGIFDHPNDK